MNSIGFLVVLAIPILYAMSNLAYKFQLHGEGDDTCPGTLMALGSVFGLIVIIPVGLWFLVTGTSLGGIENIVPLIFNEILYVVSMWIYMIVIKKEDTSNVVAWFQIIPAFGLIGAFFIIGEVPSFGGIIAIMLLMIGGFLLSFRKGIVNKRLIVLMVLCSGILALYDVIFADFGRNIEPLSAIFIALVGKTFWTALILIGKKERRGFVIALKTRLKVQVFAESTSLLADISMSLSFLFFPVALVQSACCTVPLFVLVFVAVLTKFYPKIISEDIEGMALLQKATGIILMVSGGIILSL